MTDILERLRGYNPPDRTLGEMRQTAIDIQDAADEIERLKHTIVAQSAAIENLKRRLKNPKSWYCDQCHVEVYERRCPHCGKLEKDKA